MKPEKCAFNKKIRCIREKCPVYKDCMYMPPVERVEVKPMKAQAAERE